MDKLSDIFLLFDCRADADGSGQIDCRELQRALSNGESIDFGTFPNTFEFLEIQALNVENPSFFPKRATTNLLDHTFAAVSNTY